MDGHRGVICLDGFHPPLDKRGRKNQSALAERLTAHKQMFIYLAPRFHLRKHNHILLGRIGKVCVAAEAFG